jgi:hypothetical protein
MRQEVVGEREDLPLVHTLGVPNTQQSLRSYVITSELGIDLEVLLVQRLQQRVHQPAQQGVIHLRTPSTNTIIWEQKR